MFNKYNWTPENIALRPKITPKIGICSSIFSEVEVQMHRLGLWELREAVVNSPLSRTAPWVCQSLTWLMGGSIVHLQMVNDSDLIAEWELWCPLDFIH